ncbi:hypothetical protein EXS54_00385 [Patescibacteria group bacterium]|nr:hypothetical protein [Patescibacteria group bacterium]
MATRSENPTVDEAPLQRGERIAEDKGEEIEELLADPEGNLGQLYLAARKVLRVDHEYQEFIEKGGTELAVFVDQYDQARSEKVGSDERTDKIRKHRNGPAKRRERQKDYDHAQEKGQSIGDNKGIGELATWLWAQRGENQKHLFEAVGLDVDATPEAA